MKELGVGGIRIDRSEKTIAAHLDATDGRAQYAKDPRDTATPDDMAALLVAFWNRRDGLSKASHDLLMQWMIEHAHRRAADQGRRSLRLRRRAQDRHDAGRRQ